MARSLRATVSRAGLGGMALGLVMGLPAAAPAGSNQEMTPLGELDPVSARQGWGELDLEVPLQRGCAMVRIRAP